VCCGSWPMRPLLQWTVGVAQTMWGVSAGNVRGCRLVGRSAVGRVFVAVLGASERYLVRVELQQIVGRCD
jgi:hypothetical protein